jgi:hypothetical protein
MDPGQSAIAGFYRIKPVIVMPGKSDGQANGNRPKPRGADVAFPPSAIKWRRTKEHKRLDND